MQPAPFERDPALAELLSPPIRRDLLLALPALLQTPHWQLLDAQGRGLLPEDRGTPLPQTSRYPLIIELEPLGYLCTDAPPATAQAAGVTICTVAKERWRYLMSAALHQEISQADYAELEHRHDQLQVSEARYRELAEHLEARVAEQVHTIEQQQRSLYQSEKLAAIGQLAAGVAHEINNPIGFVRSNLRTADGYFERMKKTLLCLRHLHAEEIERLWAAEDLDFVLRDGADLFRESQEGIDRVAKIVSALKEFSGVDGSGAAPTDLNQQILLACELARMQLPGRGFIEYDLNPLPRLVCHAGAVNQALLHLITNALQATELGGTVKISTAALAQRIEIRVADNGGGIAPEHRAHIFEPFFTTRQVGAGKGLGLKVCRDVALAHGGSIDFTSTPGQGTEFTLTLPLTPPANDKDK